MDLFLCALLLYAISFGLSDPLGDRDLLSTTYPGNFVRSKKALVKETNREERAKSGLWCQGQMHLERAGLWSKEKEEGSDFILWSPFRLAERGGVAVLGRDSVVLEPPDA